MWLSIAIRGLLAMGRTVTGVFGFSLTSSPRCTSCRTRVEILPEARKFGGCYVFGIQSYAQLEDIYGVKPAATLFDVMNTRAFFRSPSRRSRSLLPVKLAKRKSSRPASSTPTVLTRCVMVYRPERKRAETLVSYSDIQTLPDLSCYVTLPGPYPAVKLALKYKPRPKITEGFIPRRLDTRVDARLSALLEEREAEGVLPGHFSRRMRRHRGRLIQTVTPENSLSRSVSLPQQT